MTGAEFGLFLAHLCVWKQVKIASNGWAMEEAQSLCGEHLYRDSPCWETALAGVCCCQYWCRAQRDEESNGGSSQEQGWELPRACSPGPEGEEKPFLRVVFFSLNQSTRLLAFTALCRAKELKKSPELGQRALSRLFSLWVFTFGCV